MKIGNLLEKCKRSTGEPCKTDIPTSGSFNVALISLVKGQEIPPHPEPYAVFFVVMSGSGIFTDKDGEVELKKDDCIFMGANEIRGIKCLSDLVILGIQDKH